MKLTPTIFNLLPAMNMESGKLKAGVFCWEDSPKDSLVLVLSFLQQTTPTPWLEDLITALNCWSENPTDSMNFLLRMLNQDTQSPQLENLRVAWANYSSDPKLAFHSVLKSLSEPVKINRSEAFLENLRVGFVQLDEDPKLAFNLILKSLEETECPEVEEIRKGFLAMDQKLDQETVNHFLRFFCVMEQDQVVDQIRKSIQKYPEANWSDAFSFGQIESKIWLLEEWQKLNFPTPKMAFILGGWLGLLPAFAEAKQMPLAEKYRSFDLDSSCAPIAETVNKAMVLDNWKFKATTEDMHNINYHSHDYETLKSDGSGVRLIETPDLVINTSCEHIQNYSEWYDKIPAGTFVILQSNNYFDEPTHINCSKNLDDFQRTSPMSEVLYAGGKPFPLYNRYMLIGRK